MAANAHAQLNIFNLHIGIAALGLLWFSSPATGDPLSQPADAAATDQADDYNESDFTRPERSATLRLEIRPSSTPTSTTDRGNEILQYNSKLDLNAVWKLGMQLQVPFAEKSTTTFGQPGTENASGLGDALFQAA